MKKISICILVFALVMAIPLPSFSRGRSGGYVSGYFKSNGTYVAPYYRGPSSSSGSTYKMPKITTPKADYSYDYTPSLPKVPKAPKVPKIGSTPSYDFNKEMKKLEKKKKALSEPTIPKSKDSWGSTSSFSTPKSNIFSDSFYKTSKSFYAKREKAGFSDRSLKVVDGDTFYWQGKRYRIQGIDTPELEQPNSYEAKWRLRQILSSGMIEVKEVATDKYGRTVAKVSVNGVDVSDTLKNEGFKKPK